MTDSPIVLTAGGTGGHTYPAEALAGELLARGKKVVFITDKRSHAYVSAASEVFTKVDVHTIRSGTMGKKVAGKILGGGSLLVGMAQAVLLLRKLRPGVVIGFGGYPSFPAVFAACKLGIPALIHEQNAVLGRANRLLAGKVQRIATSFPVTRMIGPEDCHKVIVTGNPVRAAIRALHQVPYPELQAEGTMQLLITGGSQGASVFSRVVPEALAKLPVAMRARIRLDQQCRPEDLDSARTAYTQLGVSANLATFFSDIPARLAASHLVIARSGASTIAELAASGRPGILVPYPNSMDNHQYYNAEAFEDAGGGWVMEQEGFTASSLSVRLEAFLGLPSTLANAGAGARAMGRIDAAKDLADAALALISK